MPALVIALFLSFLISPYAGAADRCADLFSRESVRNAGHLSSNLWSSDPYKVLEVPQGSSLSVIRAAYLQLMKRGFDPTISSDQQTKFAQRLNDAYAAVRGGPGSRDMANWIQINGGRGEFSATDAERARDDFFRQARSNSMSAAERDNQILTEVAPLNTQLQQEENSFLAALVRPQSLDPYVTWNALSLVVRRAKAKQLSERTIANFLLVSMSRVLSGQMYLSEFEQYAELLKSELRYADLSTAPSFDQLIVRLKKVIAQKMLAGKFKVGDVAVSFFNLEILREVNGSNEQILQTSLKQLVEYRRNISAENMILLTMISSGRKIDQSTGSEFVEKNERVFRAALGLVSALPEVQRNKLLDSLLQLQADKKMTFAGKAVQLMRGLRYKSNPLGRFLDIRI